MAATKTPKERLLVALRKGRADHVAALLDQFPDDLEPDMAADTAENRLVHRAARFGHASVVTMLAAKCADLSATNKFGMTVSAALFSFHSSVGITPWSGAWRRRGDRGSAPGWF